MSLFTKTEITKIEEKELFFEELPELVEDCSCANIIRDCGSTHCVNCPFSNDNIQFTLQALVKEEKDA